MATKVQIIIEQQQHLDRKCQNLLTFLYIQNYFRIHFATFYRDSLKQHKLHSFKLHLFILLKKLIKLYGWNRAILDVSSC